MEIFLKNRINKLSYCYGLFFILLIEAVIVFFVWKHELQYLSLIIVYFFIHFFIPKRLPSKVLSTLQNGILKLVESIYLRSKIMILYLIFYYLIYAMVLYMIYTRSTIGYFMMAVFIFGRCLVYVLCYYLGQEK